MNSKSLVIVAHPHLNQSVANQLIVKELSQDPNLTLHHLYDHYPYFHIDIKREKLLLQQHSSIIFLHPFFWYSMPPLLKMWLDEVLTLGFAYGSGGNALKDKNFLLSITTGGEETAYSYEGSNRYKIDDFLTPYKQTIHLCKMKWNEPFVLHGARKLPQSEILKHAQALRSKIQKLEQEI